MKTLQTPKTNICEILHTLIDKGEVSIMDYPYMSGYRTRISELTNRHNLSLIRGLRTDKNKFNNVYSYAVYELNPFHLRNAIKLYNEINK